MKSEKGKAVGDIASLRELVVDAPEIHAPDLNNQPKGNKSSAGGGKSKKDGNRRKRNKGRS